MPLQKNIFGHDEPPRRMGFDNSVPNGYADRPGTGPAGETCKSCRHYHVREGRYRKCLLMRSTWSASTATDIRAGSPACSKWESQS